MSLESKSVAVVGGGWYGCYTALRLARHGCDVHLYEAQAGLFQGVSGNYGIRIHAGPHYPRSEVTRKESQEGFVRFLSELPDLLTRHTESIYCLGARDAEGLPPRVNWQTFSDVCRETTRYGDAIPVDCLERGFSDVIGAFDTAECSVYQDKPVAYFYKELTRLGVEFHFNHRVTTVSQSQSRVTVDCKSYDFMVNCTCYKSLVTKTLPYGAKVYYQAVTTLLYAQKPEYTHVHHPFSFTVVDGWFPCIMPKTYVGENPYGVNRQVYLLYHAKYCLLGSFDSEEECQEVLRSVTDQWVTSEFKPKMEEAITTYYPVFHEEFEYIGFETGTIAKLHSKSEFRSTLVWNEGRVVYVFPGKVSTIFQAGDDVINLLTGGVSTGVKRAGVELEADVTVDYQGCGSVQARKELNLE